jgi:hypothetical protein
MYTKSGYNRTWVGTGAAPVITSFQAPGSVLDYCYWSVPSSALTGVRSFSATGSGAIYMDQSGTAIPCPVVVGGNVTFLE